MPSLEFDPNHPAFTRALDEVRAEIEAIPESKLETIRLDIGDAVVTALGVASNVAPYRDAVAVELGAAAALPIDRLEQSAWACGCAQGRYLTSLHTTVSEERVGEVSSMRRVLMLEAQRLVAEKLIKASSLAEIVGGIGYQAMCFDVVQLVSVFRADWAAIETHTPVTSLELDRAEAMANALATTLGENEQAIASSPTADERRRAYTHFVRTYEEVRRAIAYLRFDQGDADDVAPSLYAGRTRRREDDDVIAPTPSTPIVPIVPIVVGPANGPTPVGPVSPDMPGAPPFVTS